MTKPKTDRRFATREQAKENGLRIEISGPTGGGKTLCAMLIAHFLHDVVPGGHTRTRMPQEHVDSVFKVLREVLDRNQGSIVIVHGEATTELNRR